MSDTFMKKLRPNPQVTERLLADVLWVASYIQNNPDAVTEALRDKDARAEATQLVGDLFSLFEVISDEQKLEDERSQANEGAQ